MTQEEKDLLLKDLCGRLPYGVKCENHNHVYGKNIFKVTDIRDNGYICGIINNRNYWAVFDPLELKPYLFPMSSMTEEQQKEYRKICDLDMTILENRPMKGEPFPAMYNSQDWLDANHFDYRGLIPLGLANDATGLSVYTNSNE
jgi:hypothetical protein